jgi:hypothetical protein
MRRTPLLCASAALLAVPAAALAGAGPSGGDLSQSPVPPDDAQPTAPAYSTTHAFHAQGRGEIHYTGSGGELISLPRFGRVSVRSLDGSPVTQTPSGHLRRRVAGQTTVWTGRGTLALDGSSYRAGTFAVRYRVDVDPTAAHPAVGRVQTFGTGFSILKGGVPVRYHRSHRVFLGHGPLHVSVAGSAYWHLGGPAHGTLDLTLNNRIRVWDYSAGKDAAVSGIDPMKAKTLPDGSTLYYGLRGAHVMVSGSAFRVRIHSSSASGTFTPAAGTLARSGFRGFGSFTAGTNFVNVPARVGTVTRILLQP